MSSRMQVTLNGRLRPLDRGARYEDPLLVVLNAMMPGSKVTGGGTLLSAEREPLFCDIELSVEGDAQKALALVVGALEAAGAPKGSRVRLDESDPVPFGVTEGLAIYLNGTDLPGEVYANSDINELIAALLDRLGADGDLQSYWEGPRETALYLYGASAARMDELTASVLSRFPLAQRCRVVPLALTLPSRNLSVVGDEQRRHRAGRHMVVTMRPVAIGISPRGSKPAFKYRLLFAGLVDSR
jgi:hypothetical protein